ncbi:helix-turn-helix transcriptional regulator [Tamlana sp. 2201CG12-4]|uniref:helix-turn-helix domain-containing protein n=1 Tax=Tamlana sp. 2201CG12-4 TaxID=3112582 RepID=UPI002DB88FBB|nr:helix-turn-helix transcriptional regulator [Tamlana sp. 2201CG12-4]MEC3906137.1 helix-turn-helix transcriptional regulator [Tamlana sp. 2201CG12-4]
MGKEKRKNIRDDEFLKELGVHFRKVRESKGLTQQELANRIDVEVMQISRVERGTVNTSICMIKEIADNLNIQLSELFSSFKEN